MLLSEKTDDSGTNPMRLGFLSSLKDVSDLHAEFALPYSEWDHPKVMMIVTGLLRRLGLSENLESAKPQSQEEYRAMEPFPLWDEDRT
jgi:hypothetical protein